jgi:predicted RND superfamily exporter protein
MQAIMITRLFAMYQQSRKLLILLVVVLVAITIACGLIAVIQTRQLLSGKVIYE